MKPNYAKKKAKNKQKKQALKASKGHKQQPGDGDEMMVDVEAADKNNSNNNNNNNNNNKGVDNQGAEVDNEMHDDDDTKQQGGTHKSKVEAKRALKVKMQQMKSYRTKVTKMPFNKRPAAKKEISAGMKDLIMEQQALNTKDKGKKGKGKK